jgi:hypothetical protein
MKTCPTCSAPFVASGRQRFCSNRCRKAAYRRRHQTRVELADVPARQPRRDITVYECPDCQTRYLGEQRCADCGLFCKRIGFGGPCPHCDEPVAVEDLSSPDP